MLDFLHSLLILTLFIIFVAFVCGRECCRVLEEAYGLNTLTSMKSHSKRLQYTPLAAISNRASDELLVAKCNVSPVKRLKTWFN